MDSKRRTAPCLRACKTRQSPLSVRADICACMRACVHACAHAHDACESSYHREGEYLKAEPTDGVQSRRPPGQALLGHLLPEGAVGRRVVEYLLDWLGESVEERVGKRESARAREREREREIARHDRYKHTHTFWTSPTVREEGRCSFSLVPSLPAACLLLTALTLSPAESKPGLQSSTGLGRTRPHTRCMSHTLPSRSANDTGHQD